MTGKPGSASGLNAGLDMPLAFDPGERWEYGIGIDWAGKVVEAVSGQTLGAYLDEHIFAPLGMTDTQFGRPDGPRWPPSTTAHRTARCAPAVGPARPPGAGERRRRACTRPRPTTCGSWPCCCAAGDGVLRPETVAAMGRNQIGALDVATLRSGMPALSNDAEFFPGKPKGWGYGFVINGEPGHAGRAANSLAWAGLANCYYWIDPAHRVAGVLMTQVLPFADPAVLALLDAFETAVYAGA